MAAIAQLLGNGFYLAASHIAACLGYTPAKMAALSAAPVDAVAASDTLTNNTTNVTAGETVTVDGVVYTFRATAANVGDVLRGGSADASLLNLARAINNSGGTAGTDYIVQTAHPTVSSSATVTSHAITLTARTKGAAGNAIALATTAGTLTPGAATFASGVDGTPGDLNQFGTYNGALYFCTAAATTGTSGAWKTVTLT